ncbi:MAG: hypothetical protein KGL39_40180 [Patescibacteria group bacterium]|nr:hypothetical protein [Patescibacteria group bacterium]
MKAKHIGQTWKLKSGLLYAGIDDKTLAAKLVGPDDAQVFDSRDSASVKSRFYGILLKCKFEVELCAA